MFSHYRNVVDDSGSLQMSCNTDQKVLTCIWRHTDPISLEEDGPNSHATILCTGMNVINLVRRAEQKKSNFKKFVLDTIFVNKGPF